jgi:hypothetical protein
VDESPPRSRRPGGRRSSSRSSIGSALVVGAEARIDSWIGGTSPDLALADDRDFHRRARADDAGLIETALAEGPTARRARDGRSAREYLDSRSRTATRCCGSR